MVEDDLRGFSNTLFAGPCGTSERGTSERLLAVALGLAALALAVLTPSKSALAHPDGNRLTYLREVDPWHVSRDFPRLTTPQWIEEEGVDCVVVLAIDDMREHARYEAFLRPLLERLKKIDGRAPVSVMSNRLDPQTPGFQSWLDESLTIECHTLDHPCPLLSSSDFPQARATYEHCIDQLARIPGNLPVAFRVPCMDSLNTPSPRFFREIFNRVTEEGNFLRIDSSVCNVSTSSDPELPRELVLDPGGGERFGKYLPFSSFVNTVQDYPYPYVIDRLCWELPVVVPSDWEAQNLHGVNNPRTVTDLKAQIDIAVRKKGLFALVFHPHGWIRSEQMVELVDHAVTKYGKRIKFLNFQEAWERLEAHFLGGASLRGENGRDQGVRTLDVDGDGYLDVVVGNAGRKVTRRWSPKQGSYKESEFPTAIVDVEHRDRGVVFGVLDPSGAASCLWRSEAGTGLFTWRDGAWQDESTVMESLTLDGQPLFTSRWGKDQGVRLYDLDSDGVAELIAASPAAQPGQGSAVFRLDRRRGRWRRTPLALPTEASFVDPEGRDAGLRLIDVDSDGDLDFLLANEAHYGLWLFSSLEKELEPVHAGERQGGDSAAEEIPALVRDGESRGAWFHSDHLWIQNEDTAGLADHVDRRAFRDLLAQPSVRGLSSEGRSTEQARKGFRVAPGYRIELACAEPVIRDPVNFDWDDDGRLWVVEMHDYPTGVGGGVKERGRPGGRVVVCSDDDRDGRYERSTVFAAGLEFPTAVHPWRDGALITAIPAIVYAEDLDQDGRAERITPILEGFHHGNEQHLVNGVVWGLDGWFHSANGHSGGRVRSALGGVTHDLGGRDFRWRPDSGAFEPLSGTTQFSRARDDFGHWFGCENPSPFYHFPGEARWLGRNPRLRPPASREHLIASSAAVFPSSPTVARFNDLHMANRVTSACGLTVYRDDLFPHAEGSELGFVSEPAHNLVSRFVLRREGTSFQGTRFPGESEREFLSSTDTWFRPTALRTGPDGALWVADMYREIIEHPQYYFVGDFAELDVRGGAERGRIWRVLPTTVEARPLHVERPADEVPARARWLRELASPNGPRRDRAQERFLELAELEAIPEIAALVTGEQEARVAVQALATLDTLAERGVGPLDAEAVVRALEDPRPEVARYGLRAAARRLGDAPEVEEAVLAQVAREDAGVRLALAVTLGAWNDARAARALDTLWPAALENHWLFAAMQAVVPVHFAPLLESTLTSDLPPEGRQRALDGLFAASPPLSADSWSQLLGRALATAGSERFTAIASLLELKPAGADPDERLAGLTPEARAALLDRALPSARREAALRIVAHVALRADPDAPLRVELANELARCLVPIESPALQNRAAEALAEIAPRRLARQWAQITPELRSRSLDLLLERPKGRNALLDSIELGEIPRRALDPARRQRLRDDETLAERVAAILGAPVESDRARLVEQFADAARLEGDAERGQFVFLERCAKCHTLRGQGHRVGPDLATLADRPPAALLEAILDPNRAFEERFGEYAAQTKDGRVLSGVVAEESANAIVLLGAEGKRDTLLRSELRTLEFQGRSFMPVGLEEGLEVQALADLLAALKAGGPPPKKFEGQRLGLVRAGTDGTIDCRAEFAEIRGDSLIFEPRYANLGFWGSANDRATWRIRVDRPGAYEVVLRWACPAAEAGDPFELAIDRFRLTGTIASTGTWDDYEEKKLGQVELEAGPAVLEVRSSGAPKGFLMDLQRVTLKPLD